MQSFIAKCHLARPLARPKKVHHHLSVSSCSLKKVFDPLNWKMEENQEDWMNPTDLQASKWSQEEVLGEVCHTFLDLFGTPSVAFY